MIRVNFMSVCLAGFVLITGTQASHKASHVNLSRQPSRISTIRSTSLSVTRVRSLVL